MLSVILELERVELLASPVRGGMNRSWVEREVVEVDVKQRSENSGLALRQPHTVLIDSPTYLLIFIQLTVREQLNSQNLNARCHGTQGHAKHKVTQ